MKIQTFDSNLIQAIDESTAVPDRNLPVYVSDYDVYAAPSIVEVVDVEWSTVGFVPSYVARERVFHLRLCASIRRPVQSAPLSEITFVFDFSRLGRQFTDQFNITLQGPLEGYVTEGEFIRCLSAFRHVSYNYDASTFKLLLYVRDLPPIQLPPGEPTTLFIDLSIKDDIDDPDYPVYYPRDAALLVMRIPIGTPFQGQGIRVVMPMFVCCPEELKALQLSSIDPNTEGAFNPVPEILALFTMQGLIEPESIEIDYIDVSGLPLQEEDPVDWKENEVMRIMAFLLEILFSIVPDCTVTILYSIVGEDVQRPSYMTWLSENVEKYDIVLQTTTPIKASTWDLPAFNQTTEFYETIQRRLHDYRRVFVTRGGNDGTDKTLLYPNTDYNFNLCSPLSLAIGSFELDRNPVTQEYRPSGPYKASPFNSGGYCNFVNRPNSQYGYNYRNGYGRPDLASYGGAYIGVIHPPEPELVAGTDCAAAILTALFVMLLQKTQRRVWDFKFIMYRKGMTILEQLYSGQNIGSNADNKFNAKNYPYWNPIVGFGKFNGESLFDICDVIRNNQVIQLSSTRRMNHPIAFVNAMPPNPFGDLLTRQPVMGCSSIFSLFVVKRADGFVPPSQNTEPIRGNDQVYFVDVTGRFALAYAIDDNGKWFMLLSKVNYESSAQKWILTFASDRASRDPIYAFEEVEIAPLLQPLYSMTTKWNANGAVLANSPSISTDVIEPAETFVLCSDPASTPFLNEIVASLTDDLMTYSYYVNLSTLDEDPSSSRGDQVYLNNPDFLSMESDVDAIANARNRAYTQDISPKWGYAFDPYPQWVLVPVPCTFNNPLSKPYEPRMLRNGQYMIFNTLLQSYLYIPDTTFVAPDTPSAYLKPLHSDMRDEMPFYSFVFDISDTTQIVSRVPAGPIFTGLRPYPTPVPLPPTVRIEAFLATFLIYNFRMDTEPIRDGVFVSSRLKSANTPVTDALLIDQSIGDTTTKGDINLYWVFKRYIATRATATRFIAYNDFPESLPQENAGLTLSASGSPSNVNNHAPSLREQPVAIDFAFFWFNYTDSSITDINFPESTESTYGILNEGLSSANPNATQWRIRSLYKPPNDDPSFAYALGVYGAPPQPSLLRDPFASAPDAVRWNATTLNTFYTPPYGRFNGPLRRSNYLYMNSMYTLYSMNPLSKPSGQAGFLSSAKNDGAAPSIQGTGIEPIMSGDVNTVFLLVSPYADPPVDG